MTVSLFCRSLQAQRTLLHNLPRIRTNDNRATYYNLNKIGKREIVGYGWNGSTTYLDRLDYPFPPIRYKEPDNEIVALQEKEQCSWKKLSIEEKKMLYRYSFCQTFAEMRAPKTEWKAEIGIFIWSITLGYLWVFFCHAYLTTDENMPITFDEEHQKAQLKRIIACEFNPIEGLTSKWDYEKNRWK